VDTATTSRILKGLGANAYGQLVTAIVQLVGVPVLLHAWGAQLYGEWLILFALPAYLAMTDLGFSQSASNDMTARVARDDRAGALAVFQSLGVLVYAMVGAGLILTAVLIPWIPLQEWLRLQAMEQGSARWTLWLLGAAVLAALANNVNHAGFRANADYALHVGIDATTRLTQFGGVWIVAALGGGVVAAAAVFCGIRILGALCSALLLIHRHPWLRFGLGKARSAELRRLLKPALANVAMPLAQALNVQGMVLVVGIVLGPLAVVVFSTLRTLTRLALQLVLAVAHAVEPELAAAHGCGDTVRERLLFIHSLRASLWLAVATAATLLLFGPSILDVWTHGRVAMHRTLFAWLLTSAVASVLWYGALIVLKAANRHTRAAFTYVLASAAAVAFGALLLHWSGQLANAGFSLLVTDAAMAFYALRAAGRLLEAPPLAGLAVAANPLPLLKLARGKALGR
jgi:O-antigen/teichoic acid export membrane protein